MSNTIDQLVVIAVGVTFRQGFDVAAVFLIELVDENDWQLNTRKVVQSHGCPLVPSGHEDKRWVYLQCPLPLFGKVQPKIDGVRL